MENNKAIGLIGLLDGNVFSWKVAFLAARISALSSILDMSDEHRQMYFRGMCEAFALLVGGNDQMVTIGDDICQEVEVSGETVDIDWFGVNAAISLTNALYGTNANGIHAVFEEQINKGKCAQDLLSYLVSAENKIVDKETDDLDARLQAFLDSNT